MAETAKNGRRDLMMTLVVMLLLTLVGAGMGFAVGTLLQGSDDVPSSAPIAAKGTEDEGSNQNSEAEPKDTTAAEVEPTEDDVTKDTKVLPFPPVLTTLAEPKGKWIRLEGSVVMRLESEKQPELLAEEAGEQIMAYLRSVRLSQLESASGILGLRDDLDETVRTLSHGDVRGVLIHGLVVE
jgi:flagellar FliL protein